MEQTFVSPIFSLEEELQQGYPAVILAAGQGSRLQSRRAKVPKPMVKLLGLSLLERAVLSCREAGVTEFYVVVGYDREAVIEHIEELRRRHGVMIHVVENPDWEEGNGTSALAAAPYINGSFLLTMCDHLFDPDIPRLLMEADDGTDTCLLAVDRRVDQVFDLDDATKVRLNGRRVEAIGKELVSFDAIDTGIFLCRPILFDALAEARAKGDGSLTGGIRELSRIGKIRAVDIGDRFWQDVDTPESLDDAKRRLLARLAKPRGDGWISRHVNRPLSRRVSGLLAHTPLTPNMITILSFLICLGGALLFAPGQYIYTLLAGLAVQLASIVDGCDGEIARLKFQATRFGAWFDTVLDRYADVLIGTGIAYGYAQTHPGPIAWLGGLLAVTGFILYSYTKKEFQVRYGYELTEYTAYKRIPASRDIRLFLIFVGALLGRPFEAMILAGALSHLAVAVGFVSVYRQMEPELI